LNLVSIISRLVTNLFFIGLIGIFSILIFVQTNPTSNELLAQVTSPPISNNSFYPAKDLFVASKPQGYGIYNERNSNVFQPGEDIIIYFEPVGFGYTNLKDSQDNLLYLISFSASFVLCDKNGKNLTNIINVPIPDIISHYKNKEVYIPFIITPSAPFPPGQYQIKYSLNDRNSGNTFNIVKNIIISNGITSNKSSISSSTNT
jgi:hypothetical protein